MLRVIYSLIWLLLILIPALLTAPLSPKYRRPVHLFCYKILTKVFRIKVVVHGKISGKKPILFLSNHMSYADIIILGSVLPGNFVSKAEVKKWPIFGWIATLSGTVFVSRRKSGTLSQLGDLEKAIAAGKNLILFPEGTTSEGKSVMPFKSSLLKVTESQDIVIQPVTINYTHINGLPIQANERVKIAWVGDAELVPHLREFLNLGVIRAEVKIHEPLHVKGDRKLVADEAQKIVLAGKN